MPLPPWLSTLPKAARTFYPIALKGVSQGLSANSIVKAYTAAGPGIRRSIGLEVVRRVRGVEKAAGAFRGLRLDSFPDVGRMPTALTGTLRNFSYRVGYTGIDDDGNSFSSYVTVSTNDLMSRRAVEETALGYLQELPSQYGLKSVDSVGLEDVRKSPHIYK